MASEEPRNLIERAANEAMRTAEGVLDLAGASVGTMYIAIKANGMPAGELDAVTAATGSEVPEDLDDRAKAVVAFLVAEAAQTAKALGLTVHVVPIREPGQG